MKNEDLILFEDSMIFGQEGEDILKRYLCVELAKQHQNIAFNFQDVSKDCFCQFAGLDFCIKRDLNISSLQNLALAVIDAIEIKSHLWVNFDNHIADLAFEVYSDYDEKIPGWVEKTIDTLEKNILPFVRVFWINKHNLWIASVQLNRKFIEFWKTNPWRDDHRINKPSYHEGKSWRSSWSPIPVLSLLKEGIPYTCFKLKEGQRKEI